MKIVNDHVTFSKPEATALLKTASNQEDKPHLYGIWIDARQGKAYATDGHRLILVQSTQDIWATQHAGEPCLVPRPVWQRAMRMVPAKGTLRVRSTWAEGSEASHVLGVGACTIWLDAIDAEGAALGSTSCTAPDLQAPPIEQIIPDLDAAPSPRVSSGLLDGRYLADAAAVQRAAGTVSVRVTPPSHNGEPWAFTAEGHDAKVVYVVMAVRANEEGTHVSEETAISYAAGIISARRGHGKIARAALWHVMTTAAGPSSAATPTPAAPPAPKAKRQRRESEQSPEPSAVLRLVQ